MGKKEALPADHSATVVINDDFTLSFTTKEINMLETDIGTTRKNISVVPAPEDVVVNIEDHPEHFDRLTSMNVSLTNACNLSCNYCYEQHNRDFGRFTVETIKQAYDFLRDINDLSDKTFIFFGGEPLIHKKLILDFLRTYKEEVEQNDIKITMISNGLLLENAFIDEYFKAYSKTNIVVSLDTFNSEIDERKIPQERLNLLKERIAAIPKDRITVRPTISHQTALTLKPFLDELVGIGVHKFILQPLIMGNLDGFIDWTDGQWEQLTGEIFQFLRDNTECEIEVTEGVGSRSMGNNCLSGYDIISIDPSGDFSGCFFFVNQKQDAGNLISGNIFQEKLYINREEQFDKAYRNMFEENEQCRTCDLQDHCYQCPAGNLDVSGTLYRPDSMCQRFVKFYLDINNEQFQIRFKKIMTEIIEGYSKYGREYYGVKLAEYYKKETNKQIAEHVAVIKKKFWEDVSSKDVPVNLTMKDLFEELKEQKGIKVRTLDPRRQLKVDEEMLYLTLMGVSIYDL